MIILNKNIQIGKRMKTLHSFYIENKAEIKKSFNTFKKWITEVEELKKYIETITLNNRKKFFVKDENKVLEFFKKFN